MGLLELARLFAMARAVDDYNTLQHADLAELGPARAALPELARDLAAAGVPPDTQAVRVVDDATRPSPVALGYACMDEAAIGGQYQGLLFQPRRGVEITVERIHVESASATPDFRLYLARTGTAMPAAVLNGKRRNLPLGYNAPTLDVYAVRNVVQPGLDGVDIPFGLGGEDFPAPLTLRQGVDDNTGEVLQVWARTVGINVRIAVWWSEQRSSTVYVP